MEQVGPLVALGLLPIGASALIVARVSVRQLLPVLLVWLFAPVILLAALVAHFRASGGMRQLSMDDPPMDWQG